MCQSSCRSVCRSRSTFSVRERLALFAASVSEVSLFLLERDWVRCDRSLPSGAPCDPDPRDFPSPTGVFLRQALFGGVMACCVDTYRVQRRRFQRWAAPTIVHHGRTVLGCESNVSRSVTIARGCSACGNNRRFVLTTFLRSIASCRRHC